MPILVPEVNPELKSPLTPFYERLGDAGTSLVSEVDVQDEGVPKVRVGFLNLMPGASMEAAEADWFRHLGSLTGVYVEVVPLKFDNDPRGKRDESQRKHFLESYRPFSEVATEAKNGPSKKLDGLIITGDNLELAEKRGLFGRRKELSFEDIYYQGQLTEVRQWANHNVNSTIYSCLASHIALNEFYQLRRRVGSKKRLGVFDNQIVDPSSPFMQGITEPFRIPHSRWGDIASWQVRQRILLPGEDSLKRDDVRLLAVSKKVGWSVLSRRNRAGGTDLFLQGHPEYDTDSIDNEVTRDLLAGERVRKPWGYYSTYDPRHPERNVYENTWSEQATQLLKNWVDEILRSRKANILH